MRIFSRRALQLVLLVALAAPSLVSADPIQITSGFVRVGGIDPRAQFAFEGEGFSVAGFAQAFNSTMSLCFPCAPGTTLDLGGAFHGPDALGSGVVDGIAYPTLFFNGMTGTFSSSPSFQVSGDQALTVIRNFTFTGEISGYLINPFVHGFTEPVFTKSLMGQGIVRGEFLVNADRPPLFFATSLNYEFADTAPVPEPTTLLLVGTGAALAASRR